MVMLTNVSIYSTCLLVTSVNLHIKRMFYVVSEDSFCRFDNDSSLFIILWNAVLS